MVKGQWIPERKKKTPGVLQMCGGEGGAGPSQRQCKGQHGEAEAPAVDFLHFTRGGRVRGQNLPYGHHNDQPRTDRCNHTSVG